MFAYELLAVVGLDVPTHLNPESRLVEDLDFDSLAVIEVLMWFEEHGVEVPEQYVEFIKTVGDLFRQYEVAFDRGEWCEPLA